MSKRFITFVVLFLMTLVQLGTDIYLPSLPAIKADMLTTSANVQLSFSIFLGFFAVSQLVYGPLSDRFGRRPFLLFGSALYLIMSLVAAGANSISVLLVARCLQGVGAGSASVISRAIMRDSFAGEELHKITLYQAMVWSLIPISAPLVGSYIQHYLGWRYNFLLLGIFALIACILAFLLKETIHQKEKTIAPKQIFTDYVNMLLNKKFFSHMVCAGGVISLFAAFNVSAPMLMQETLHLTPVQYGWSVFSVAAFFLIGAFINKKLMNRYDGMTIAFIGMINIIITVILFVMFSVIPEFNLMMLILPLIFSQIGSALVFPVNAAKVMEIFPNKAGKAAALFGAGIFLCGTITSIVMSILPETSLRPLATVYFAIIVLMSIFHRRITHRYA